MIRIYGSSMCGDCRQCRADLDARGVDYEFIDINEDLMNLKAFLALRDGSPVFDSVRKAGGIGIPAIVKDDGEVTLDWETCL